MAKAGSPVEWPHWSYAYDANGNQVAQTDPNGHTTTFAYDERGLRTRRTLPGSEHEDWVYDDYGRLLAHVDFKGQTTAYLYGGYLLGPEAQGRVGDEYRFVAGLAAFDVPLDREHMAALTDHAVDHLRATDAAERTHYHYDALARVDTVDEYDVTTLVRSTTTTYDPVTGGVASVTSPEGVVTHEYDPTTGQLVRTPAGGHPNRRPFSFLNSSCDCGRALWPAAVVSFGH